MPALRRLCVFCGSSTGNDERHRAAAEDLAAAMVERGIDLVYGGGSVGLMGVVADAVLAGGGGVTGVIPRGLFGREIAHRAVTDLRQVDSMHDRKALMYDLSDAFVALPGGLGTLEELAEVATWAQLGLHAKPVALLDVAGFWGHLVAQLDRMATDGLLRPANRALIRRYDTPIALLDALATVEAAATEGWIRPEER